MCYFPHVSLSTVAEWLKHWTPPRLSSQILHTSQAHCVVFLDDPLYPCSSTLCSGNLRKFWGYVTCSGLASYPGKVEILHFVG